MAKTPSSPPARPYHHGDLRAALLVEAERILEAEGLGALTLRAAARGVGVSHAAPKNHFGDLSGLLSELAAIGFNRFSERLIRAVITAGREPRDRARALGRAYVAFARAHPALFRLMFRGERLDDERPALRDALEGLREALGAAGARAPPRAHGPARRRPPAGPSCTALPCCLSTAAWATPRRRARPNGFWSR